MKQRSKVDFQPDRMQFTRHTVAPGSFAVQRYVQHAVDIAGEFDALFVQDNHPVTAKLCYKETEFKYDILASPALLRLPNRATFVISGKEDDCTRHSCGLCLELLDDSSATICLFVQYDGLASDQLRQEPGHRHLGLAVVTVHDEDLCSKGSGRVHLDRGARMDAVQRQTVPKRT